MSQVSEILVKWTPETSGRVASMQIQSRIAGQPEWTEQSASFDPSVGEFRFTSNAPATDVEVRARYRMIDGVFGAWFTDHIVTAPAVVEYDTISGAPTNLSDINPTQGGKLDGIEDGATNGAVIGGNVKNPDGSLYVPVTTDYEDIRHEVEQDITSALNTAKAGLDADIQSVRNDVTSARGEITQAKTDLQTGITGAATAAQQARDDLASEVTRAKGAEGTLTTNLASVKQTADKATTDISDEITARTNADSALGNRTSTVEAQLRGDQDSGLAAKVRDEASARVNADDALSGRVSTTEAKLNGSQDSAIAAAVRDEATARTNADGALGTRLQTIEADYVTNGGAGSIAQAKVNDEATARSNADSALSTRAGTLEAQMRGEQDSTLAARIRDEATARTDAVSAVAGRTSTLETASFGAGNLLSNTDFGTLDGWTITNNPNGVMQLQLNGAGDGWHPVGENALTIYQPGRLGGNYGEAQSSPFAVTEGEWLQFYAFTASHRSRAWTTLFFMDSAGNNRGYAGENFGARTDAGGQALAAFDQTGLKACQVPAGATQARFAVRKYDTVEGQGDSWGWFVRPYVGRARQGQTEWNPYSPGSAKVTVAATNTKIGDEATARSNADSALSGRVSTTEAKLNGDQDSTLAARIRDEATARADAVSAVAGRTSTLETRSAQTPVSFIARAYGNGDGQSPFGHTSGVANASGTMIGVNGRSYGVYVFNSANTLIAANSYDVYGTGGQPEAMAAFLNGITNGQAVIITTADEPANNRLNGGLVAAMERCGAGDLFYTAARPSDFKYHSAYVLIGRAGIGRGNGQEFYKGDYDTAPNSWLEVRFDLLNGVPVLGGAGAQFLTNAKISDEATARSNADSAISNRVSTTEAQMRGDQDSTLAARIRDETTARTNADGALATRATNLEVSATASSANTLNQNPSFSFWTDPNGLPNGWGYWDNAGTNSITRYATDNSSGGYAFRHNVRENVNAGIMQGAIRLQAGWYVMEADIELLDGTLQGAGLTVEGVFSMHFATEADVNGEVSIGGWKRRRFTKLFKSDRALNNWHLMTNWDGFGGRAYKYVDWHYCGVRPATAGEILAQKVDNDMNGAGGALARIGAEETARANGDSAIAGRTSTLEAVANRNGYLNRNATFAEPWNGTGLPPAWGIWQQEGGGFYGAWSGNGTNYGSKAFQWDRNGTNSGFFQAIYGQFPKGWYVLEAEIRLEDGNTWGSGLHANFMNGYSGEVNFGTEPDTHEYTGNRGNGNYHFTKLIFNGDNSSQINLHPMAGWSSLSGWSGFLRTIWFKAGIRPATTSEIKSGKVDGIGARLTTVESTTATVNGKTQAYFSKTASVQGAEAFITAQALNDAGQATSNVAIGGSSVAIYNTEDGSAKRALFAAAGNVTFDGFITARSGIRIGDGQWNIAVSPKDFAVSNGQGVSYGYDLGRVPSVTFGACPIALNAGEVYRAYAANSTSTGFTAVCEIVAAPVSSNQSVGPGYSVNGAQAFDVGKSTPDATNGTYNFAISGTAQAYAYRDDLSCVHVDAWLTDDLQAGDAQTGDPIMVLTEHGEAWEPAKVEASYVAESHCVRITTASGIQLTCSEDTPITLRDGKGIWVREAVGEDVPVLDEDGFRWEPIVSLEEIGLQPVARLSCWSGTYAAGDVKGRMIFTHNIDMK